MIDANNDTVPIERRMTLRLPEMLARRIQKIVAERKASERKFSTNDWLVEAVRSHADKVSGPPDEFVSRKTAALDQLAVFGQAVDHISQEPQNKGKKETNSDRLRTMRTEGWS